MKILYISTPAYADCDFPLIKTYQDLGIDITYIITIGPFNRRSTLIDLNKRKGKVGVFPALEFEELKVFENYMDMNNVFISYRNGRNILSPSTWIENFKLRKFIFSQKFDIIHTDDYYRGLRNWIYKTDAKVVVTHHDPFPHTGEKYKKPDLYRFVIQNASGNVLLNKNQKDEFCNVYNLSPSKILLNRLSVYENIRSYLPDQIEHRKHNILFFGRISPYKGIEYLCEAMESVRQYIPDATLTIAGSGNLYFDTDPYKQRKYIEFKNYFITLPELASLLSQCDVCVCPYTDATQSGVIMTSYAMGKPVVGTKVGGLPEMIEEGKTGTLVPPKNSGALAKALIELLEDEDKLKKMSSYIINEYYNGSNSWMSIAKKYIQYYNTL